jgi:CheY-like chemotaxis protein
MSSSKRLPSVLLPPSAGEVLVVEDDRLIRETTLEMLALAGFMAAGVENGAEALEFLTRETPGVILLDLRMPVLDGWGFLRRRAADPALRAIPVVILSGEPLDEALAHAVEGWIEKPFAEEELLNLVADLLREGHARRRANARAPAAPPVAARS